MTQEEEKKIIYKVIGGDKNAFEALVLANQKNVYNLALKMTRNAEDALDISQETFVRAYNKLADFRFDARFSVWLYKLAYNLCIDSIRRNPGTKTLSLDCEDGEGNPVLPEITDMRNLPEDSVLRKELRKSIAESIGELPAAFREIIVMREITGMSYDNIAESLGINPNTVKSRLSRARLKLAEILVNKGTFPESHRLKIQGKAK